ncbi:MAG: hypothetical protein ACRBDL_07650 [Alphaproteobacteria bacterium]
MPRTHTQKNPYFKNSRLTIEETELLVLMYFRQTKNFDYGRKLIHGSYFAALKRGEYKVKNVVGGAGDTVPTPLLYPEQKEAMENGMSFVSTLGLAFSPICSQ